MSKARLGFPVASPCDARLDEAALEDFRAALKRETDLLHSLAGASHVVLHRGRCVVECSSGYADRSNGVPFSTGTLCRLHGATKPLVAAAFLTLVDAGKCKLSDPISKFLPFPEWKGKASARYKRAQQGQEKLGVATLRDLLTNTAGLTNYEQPRNHAGILRRVREGSISDLTGLCDALCMKPLASPPGTRYEYSFAYDMLGRLCEVVSGLPLPAFMQKSLFGPCGMTDTHFSVPERKRKRAARLYEAHKLKGKKGARRLRRAFKLKLWHHKDSAPGILSGGGGILSYNDAGLWSTVKDYAHFCQMLLDGGVAPNGRRILRKATAASIWTDALAAHGGRDGRLRGWHDQDGKAKGSWWDYRGLNLLHSFLDFEEAPSAAAKTRRSSSMWFSGGGGVFWTIDKTRQLVTLSFTQCFGGREDDSDGQGPLAYRIAPYVE
eukprot:TRINITY_DN43836_c0_g1_i2.p1 TRINITY_DN43836_c0_g1~~TRINITY_DN43836_c0_g1_i2.p1  ORF type:complete len:452 (+),score=48.77 TRINITY_DN43836_c0_g1_i2:47-1357(+)